MNPNIRNKEFYNALKELTNATFKLVIESLETGKIALKFHQTRALEIQSEYSGCTVEHVIKPSIWTLMEDIQKPLRELSEYKSCVTLMENNPEVSKHMNAPIGTSDFRCGFTADMYLQKFLQELLSQLIICEERQKRVSSELFNDAYAKFEPIFYSDSFAKLTISPLHSFQCNVLIELSNNLRIRKLDRQEQAKVLEDLTDFRISNKPLLPFGYIIELDHSSKKVFGQLIPGNENFEENDIAKETINKVVTTLRLFKAGYVGNSFIKTTYAVNLPISGNSYSGEFTENNYPICYVIEAHEINDLKALWKKIEASSDSVALRRFNYSYCRENLEDRLIDMMIAFEALYLKGEKGGPSSGAVVAVACSVLIGRNDKDRKEIKENMLKAYTVRNSIVHGSEFERYKKDPKTGAKKDLLQELVSNLSGYLRESLKKLL